MDMYIICFHCDTSSDMEVGTWLMCIEHASHGNHVTLLGVSPVFELACIQVFNVFSLYC